MTKYRILLVSSHPVQYAAPIYRWMAQHPKLEIFVAYCSLYGAEALFDQGFGQEITWDVSLLNGYPWVQLENKSPMASLNRFFGLINPSIWKHIRSEKYDAVIAYTGYNYFTFWIAYFATKFSQKRFLFSTDAHEIAPHGSPKLKSLLKQVVLPKIFALADKVIVSSSLGVDYVKSLGIPEADIVLTPFAVDNSWWIEQSKNVNKFEVRSTWGIPEAAKIILFCAKLIPRKRPQDLLQAFAKADIPDSYLVFAGDGEMRHELEAKARMIGIADKVRFLGFVNQSQLPAVYTSADVFTFCSDNEPFGVVVNEAMLCGCPVVVSNRVGARLDLVREGETGFIYTCGDVDALAKVLTKILLDNELRNKMSIAAIERMKSWSPRENVEAIVEALDMLVPGKSTSVSAQSD